MCCGLCYICGFAPLPFLFSLVSPFHNKEVYGSKASSSSFAIAVSEWQKVFSSRQGHTVLFKNKFVVFKCSKRLEMLNFQLPQDAGRPVWGWPCAAPVMVWGCWGRILQPQSKNLSDVFLRTAVFSRQRPFFPSCLFL